MNSEQPSEDGARNNHRDKEERLRKSTMQDYETGRRYNQSTQEM